MTVPVMTAEQKASAFRAAAVAMVRAMAQRTGTTAAIMAFQQVWNIIRSRGMLAALVEDGRYGPLTGGVLRTVIPDAPLRAAAMATFYAQNHEAIEALIAPPQVAQVRADQQIVEGHAPPVADLTRQDVPANVPPEEIQTTPPQPRRGAEQPELWVSAFAATKSQWPWIVGGIAAGGLALFMVWRSYKPGAKRKASRRRSR